MKCPSCGEHMLAGTSICKACGYDFSDRHRARSRGGRLTPVIVAAAVLAAGLVLAFSVALSRKRPSAPVKAVAGDTVRKDSLGAMPHEKEVRPAGRETTETKNVSRPAPGQALVKDYQDKIDALLEKVSRTRKKLNDSRRMTQKSQDALNRIESDLNGTRGMIGTLATTPTRESQNALKAVVENRLAEIRKHFAEVEP